MVGADVRRAEADSGDGGDDGGNGGDDIGNGGDDWQMRSTTSQMTGQAER